MEFLIDHLYGLDSSFDQTIYCTSLTKQLLLLHVSIDPDLLVITYFLVFFILSLSLSLSLPSLFPLPWLHFHEDYICTLFIILLFVLFPGWAGTGWAPAVTRWLPWTHPCHSNCHRLVPLSRVGHVSVWGLLWDNLTHWRLQVQIHLENHVKVEFYLINNVPSFFG